MPKKKIYWKRVPKNIPKEWESVLLVFKKEDTPRINETHLFQDLLVLSNISELKVREICIDMEKCGLLEYSYNSYILKERAFKLINRLSSV
jgi:DNA-binding IclR family transcriptional regulator